MLGDLTVADAAAAAALSASFGWPHRAEDWDWFLRLGQGVAWREGGALLGTAVMFPQGTAHGAIGLVQVAQALQGRGIGRVLIEAVLALGAGRSLKLHATRAGVGLYARLGFGAQGVVEQWQGVVGPGVSRQGVSRQGVVGHGTARIAVASEFEALRTLDRLATGLDRGPLLQALFEMGRIAVSGPAAAPTGFAVRRRFGRGALVGPVIARDSAEAAGLVATLQEPGFMRLDTPAGSGLIEAVGVAELASVETVQVMVRGQWPATAVFGLASQAIG